MTRSETLKSWYTEGSHFVNEGLDSPIHPAHQQCFGLVGLVGRDEEVSKQ